MNKTIYLSGPMTGLPQYNYPAFNEAAAQLRALGLKVVNPAELAPPGDANDPQYYHQCLRTDIKALMNCDTICTLTGWQNSKGACLEVFVARSVGIEHIETVKTLVKKHQMALTDYDWSAERIEPIGQNGNDGDHYNQLVKKVHQMVAVDQKGRYVKILSSLKGYSQSCQEAINHLHANPTDQVMAVTRMFKEASYVEKN